MNNKILVIDDEISILTLLRMNLEMKGFSVATGTTGHEAVKLAIEEKPDLILLDLMLPDFDGVEACKRIRHDARTKNIPIIMLTAKAEETDKVISLEMGADDYITKPFGSRELVARINAVLRRAGDHEGTSLEDDRRVEIEDLLIDIDRHKVWKIDVEIELTHMEFKLLLFFVRNREKVLERRMIVDELTEKEHAPDMRSIDVHVWNLRKKLSKVPPNKEYIETIRGVGYRFK